jgi:hypothetical protein
MGVYSWVGIKKFPVQGTSLGKRVRVIFNYDLTEETLGTILRYDAAGAERITAIQLDDGRIVLGTECQYSLISDTDRRVPNE